MIKRPYGPCAGRHFGSPDRFACWRAPLADGEREGIDRRRGRHQVISGKEATARRAARSVLALRGVLEAAVEEGGAVTLPGAQPPLCLSDRAAGVATGRVRQLESTPRCDRRQSGDGPASALRLVPKTHNPPFTAG